MVVTIILLALIGLAAAMFGSLVGLGGGIIIVPALILLGPHLLGTTISTQTAVGTSLAVLIFTALSSTLAYTKVKCVDWRSGIIYFITSGPASMLGATLTPYVKAATFHLVFGLLMLGMAVLILIKKRLHSLPIEWYGNRLYVDASGQAIEYGYSVVPMLFSGFAVGFASGLFGIGGGALLVPCMVLLFRYPPYVACATSMFVIFLSSTPGMIVHAWNGSVRWMLVAILAPSAWIGGRLGATLAIRMSSKGLLLALHMVLLILAVHMIVNGIWLMSI